VQCQNQNLLKEKLRSGLPYVYALVMVDARRTVETAEVLFLGLLLSVKA